MAILDKSNDEKIKKYNKYIEEHESSNIYQNIDFAKTNKKSIVECVYLEKNDNIIAAMTLYIIEIRKGYNLIYAKRGPICDIYDFKLIKEIMEEVEKIVKKYKAFMFCMDPFEEYNEKLILIYKSKGFKVKPSINFSEIDISNNIMQIILQEKTMEDIESSFNEKTKYNISVAKKRDMTVNYIDDVNDLGNLKMDFVDIEYIKKIFSAFGNGNVRIYFATIDNKTAAYAMFVFYGDKMYFLENRILEEFKNYMPQYLLQQEAIAWAIEKKCVLFDFGRINHNNQEEFRFKEGFCKQEINIKLIGNIIKIYNKRKYFVLHFLIPKYKKIKQKIKRIKLKIKIKANKKLKEKI